MKQEKPKKPGKGRKMPNWCENTLRIRGKKEDLEAFKKQLEDSKLQNKDICIFETFHPMPKEYRGVNSPNRDEDLAKELTEKYGSSDWYDWANSNWGTKWGCCDTRWHIDEPLPTDHDELYDLEMYYQTAWSPGDDCLEDIFQGLNHLSFFLTYEEPGMGFAGSLFVRNGTTEYKETREYVADDIESMW